jgi:hypothetical protein
MAIFYFKSYGGKPDGRIFGVSRSRLGGVSASNIGQDGLQTPWRNQKSRNKKPFPQLGTPGGAPPFKSHLDFLQ